MPDRIICFGAGGLSLGFFGPELQDDYALTFLDIHYKADLIEEIQERHSYVTNVAGEEVDRVTVSGVNAWRLDVPDQDAAIREDIAQARIFFTAVGLRNLDSALSYLAERIEGRTESIYILCAENGEDVAEGWRQRTPPNIHICETVMGRMCRIEDAAAPVYAPVEPTIEWGVVGEALFDMPLEEAYHDPDVFHSKAFLFCPTPEFHARDRVKLFAHNGGHFSIAVQGRLRGVERFSDLADDPEVTAATQELLDNEIGPALWKDCAQAIGRDAFDAYMTRLPKRLFSKTLADHIARGVRGIETKFLPNERVMGGLKLLLDNGIKPDRYCDLIAGGLEVARRDTSDETADNLLNHIPDRAIRDEVARRWHALKTET